jgi:hypothetical protein
MNALEETVRRIEREHLDLVNHHYNQVNQMEVDLVAKLATLAEELDEVGENQYDPEDMRDSIKSEYNSDPEDYIDQLVSNVDVYSRILEYAVEDTLLAMKEAA